MPVDPILLCSSTLFVIPMTYAIIHIVIVSIIAGYQLDRMWVAVVGTGWAIYVYCYGYAKNTMAFSPSYIESRMYHATTHLVIGGGWIYGVSLIRSIEETMKHAAPAIEV